MTNSQIEMTLEAERAVLGRMMDGPEHITAASTLKASDFFTDTHRQLFGVFRDMTDAGLSVDVITAKQELQKRGILDSLGGYATLLDLQDHVFRVISPTAQFVEMIRKHAQRRMIRRMGETLLQRAEEGDDPDEILCALQGEAIAAQVDGASLQPEHISSIILPAWEELQEEMNATGATIGLPTGVANLDKIMGGWRKGELTYVGALPGRGKTAFMLQSMFSAASAGHGVGCISLEMRKTALVRRLTTMQSKVPSYKFRDPRVMNASDRNHVRDSMFALGDLPVWIKDLSGLRPAAIVSLARQMQSLGAEAVFVDFVQIIREDGKDRREAINRVSAALRDAAKSLQIPFVVLSQLARRDGDPNRRPTLQDLRESGNLEQDCHNALFLHRMKDKAGDGGFTGEDFIFVEKQREGETGALRIHYDPDTLTFQARHGGQTTERSVA